MFRIILIALVFVSSAVYAGDRERDPKDKKPVLHEISNKDVVKSVYPEAVKVEKVNDYWYSVLDNENHPLGYAMSSTPYCKNIKGYNETTPVMILTDRKWVIKKVAILSNWETLSYIRKLEKKGFFNLWVGKTLTEAKSVRPDGYTGATMTVVAVTKNVNFLLKNGVKKLPKAN